MVQSVVDERLAAAGLGSTTACTLQALFVRHHGGTRGTQFVLLLPYVPLREHVHGLWTPNRGPQVSEGIDFSDDAARMCVIVGIPYPSSKDLQVGWGLGGTCDTYLRRLLLWTLREGRTPATRLHGRRKRAVLWNARRYAKVLCIYMWSGCPCGGEARYERNGLLS